MTKQGLIDSLQLSPHPLEGGYFRRTYTSSYKLAENADRCALSSIYYLLTDDQPLGYLHSNRSDIIHYFHAGGAMEYVLISPEGSIERHYLGLNLHSGELPQLLVPGGYWKASRLLAGEYGLISEAVSPGFDFADNELATKEQMAARYPGLIECIESYIAPS